MSAKRELMPRTADKHLEKRILDAGYKLWSKGGEAALTMRNVALAAGTTTPTVYERFSDKKDLIRSLRERASRKLFLAIRPSSITLEACRRTVDFALTHGQEYLLLTTYWAERIPRKEKSPTFEFLKELLAKELGDTPAKHAKLAFALIALVHGTAIFLLAEDVPSEMRTRLRRSCLSGCEALLRAASRNVSRARRR